MIRIVLFLLFIALAAAGAAWGADQPGHIVLSWGRYKATAQVPVFAAVLGIIVVAGIIVWSLLHALWLTPERIRRHHRERRHARGRRAIPHALLVLARAA